MEFNELMEKLKGDIAEFSSYGNVEEVATYSAKAKSIQAQLDDGIEKIENFNREEDAFEWDITQYPLRHKLASQLDPYLKVSVALREY